MKRPVLFLFCLYFLTRFFNLLSLPIFNDEAIYLHWGQIMVSVPGQAFYSLFDGKPPLILWLLGYFQNLPLDPLIMGRLVSIFAGAITLFGLWQVTKLLGFSEKTQLLAGLLYVTNPLALFFDRLAILDSPVSAVFIWVLYFSLKISQSKIINHQSLIIIGLVQGVGLWIKGSTQLFLFLPFIIPCLTLFLEKNLKKARFEFLSFLGSLALAQILFLPIRFQPLFASFQKREGDFLISLDQAFLPGNWLPHLNLSLFTLLIYISPLVLILAFLGGKRLFQKQQKETLVIFGFFFLPLLFEILFARYFLSRYFLFTILPILIFTAYGLTNLKSLKIPIAIASLLIPISISIFLISNPFTLKTLSFNNVLKSDLFGYVSGWPSGYGVKEAADWLEEEAKKGPLVVITRADSGNPEDAMFVYLAKNKNIILAQANRPPTKEELAPLSKFPLYFVSRGEQYLGMKGQLAEKVIFRKPEGPEFVGLYQIKN